jgi:hypothetical protein
MTSTAEFPLQHFVRRVSTRPHRGLVRLAPRPRLRPPAGLSFPYADRPDVPANFVLGED